MNMFLFNLYGIISVGLLVAALVIGMKIVQTSNKLYSVGGSPSDALIEPIKNKMNRRAAYVHSAC